MKDYKKILEGVVNIINTTEKSDIGFANICSYIGENCPELKESEDEKMRKGIIRNLEYLMDRAEGFVKDELKERIAWLEKQGEEKLADKVEPKFHESDWVIDKQGIVHQIANVIKNVTYNTYGYDIVGGGYFNDNTEGVRLWTIQDAKDGDVLVDENNNIGIYKEIEGICWHSYIYLGCGNRLYGFSSGGSHMQNNTKPATKEQRDLLFQKMKEVGYEWGALAAVLIDNKCDKKEHKLEKIKQKNGWSEEDERIYQSIMDDTVQENQLDGKQIDWLRDIKYRYFPQPKSAWSEEDEEKFRDVIRLIEQGAPVQSMRDHYTNWLKSLKERYTWKPSDEQMEALANALSLAKNCGEETAFDLRTLYEQLKKLREE